MNPKFCSKLSLCLFHLMDIDLKNNFSSQSPSSWSWSTFHSASCKVSCAVHVRRGTTITCTARVTRSRHEIWRLSATKWHVACSSYPLEGWVNWISSNPNEYNIIILVIKNIVISPQKTPCVEKKTSRVGGLPNITDQELVNTLPKSTENHSMGWR